MGDPPYGNTPWGISLGGNPPIPGQPPDSKVIEFILGILYEINNLGATLKSNLKIDKNIKNISILANSISDESVMEFAYGYELKSYTFNKYKSKKNDFEQSVNFTVKNEKFIKST